MAQSATIDNVSHSMSQLKDLPVSEGNLTKRIENQTAKLPSIGFLGLALGSMALSAAIAGFARRKEMSTFVGLWAPSFLLLGIYNKLVKIEANSEAIQSK